MHALSPLYKCKIYDLCLLLLFLLMASYHPSDNESHNTLDDLRVAMTSLGEFLIDNDGKLTKIKTIG